MTHKNELMSANTHQNVMKLEYDINEYFAHPYLTTDDFLKNFLSPDENILKFHDIFIRASELYQKVIRSEPETF